MVRPKTPSRRTAVAWTLLALAAPPVFSAPAAATKLRVATWNLGWHLSQAEAADWIARCDAPFLQDATGTWRPAPAGVA